MTGTEVTALRSAISAMSGLTPMSKRVIVTDRLRALVRPGAEFTVRIVPYVRPEHAGSLPDSLVADLLQLERVDLLTYQ